MRHTAVKLACAAAILTLAGCSTIESWNPFSSKKPKNAPVELTPVKATLNVRTAWQASVGSGEKQLFSPALLDGSVVVASAAGNIQRLEAGNGRSLWRVSAGMPLTAGVGADADTIAVVGEKGWIIAFDREGKQRWKTQASSEILSAPAVGGGVVVVRSVDNRIAGYDAATGVRKWSLQRSVPSLILRHAPGITIAGTNAYVALPGGRIVAVSVANGVQQWEGVVAEPKGATELERVADVTGAPVVIGRDVCAVAFQGKVACFDATNGAQRWSKDLSSEAGVGVDERFVFTADDKGNVTAFTRDNGVSVWRNTALGYRRLSTPYSWDRAVTVGDLEGYVHFLSREDGAIVARTKIGKGAIVSAPVLAGSQLIFQTREGEVVALATE